MERSSNRISATLQNPGKSISKIANHVMKQCNELTDLLLLSIDGISSYTVKITERAMSTDFVDRILDTTYLLKHHVRDVKKFVAKTELHPKSATQLIEHLHAVSDEFTTYMVNNGCFRSMFGEHVKKIQDNIHELIQKIPLVPERSYNQNAYSMLV
jgi:hypothetical protein